jgi:integrase
MITNRELKAVKPVKDGRTHFLPDGAVGGLGVLYGAKGIPSWTLAYRDHTGKQVRVKLGFAWSGPSDATPPGWLTIDRARQEAYRLKEAARAGDVVPARPIVHVTGCSLEDAISDYAAKVLANKRTGAAVEHTLRTELAHLLPRPLRTITRSDIRNVLDGITGRGAGYQANRFHSVLGTFYRRWALDRGLVTQSPVPDFRPFDGEKKRQRVLTDKELAAVWHATDTRPLPQQCVTRLLILCGQRLGETREMEWGEVDFEARTWTIPAAKAKNEFGHQVQLSEQAIAVIRAAEKYRLADCPYIFTSTGRQPISMSVEGGILKEVAGFNSWRLHDLRKAFATGCQRLGVKTDIIDRCQNHVAVKGSGAHYMFHEYLAERRAAFETWGRHIAKIIPCAFAEALCSLRLPPALRRVG